MRTRAFVRSSRSNKPVVCLDGRHSTTVLQSSTATLNLVLSPRVFFITIKHKRLVDGPGPGPGQLGEFSLRDIYEGRRKGGNGGEGGERRNNW